MITFQQFKDKYNGKKIDFDNAYQGQCVDLFRQYNKEVLGIPQPKSVIGAADFWTNYETDSVLNTNFDKISNSATFIPKEGDVALWNKKMGGGYGHVGVCTGKGDLNTFESFDQNWKTISVCELITHTYSSFYGVLRPKGVTTSDNIETLKRDLSEQQQQVRNYVEQVAGWEKKYNECNTQRIEAGASADGFRKQLNELVAKLAQILGTRQEVPEIIASIETAITFEDKAEELTRRIELEERDHREAVSGLEAKIKALESNLASLKRDLQAVKDTQITPTQPTSKYSILELILNLFKRS